MQSGGLAGEVEGIVSSLGLLYATLARGEGSIMVLNNVVLGSAVVPLREPSSLRSRNADDDRSPAPPDENSSGPSPRADAPPGM